MKYVLVFILVIASFVVKDLIFKKIDKEEEENKRRNRNL